MPKANPESNFEERMTKSAGVVALHSSNAARMNAA
jgi:hypothetical protein